MSKFIPQELALTDKSPLSSNYAETFVYAPAATDEENLGYLYLAAEVASNKTKKENARLAAEIAQTLKNEYYKNTIVTPLSAFRFALKRVNQFIASETKWLTPTAALKLKLVAGSLKENTLHLARLGDAAAFILRNDNLQSIIPASASNAASTTLTAFDAARTKQAKTANWSFENIVSGELLNEDQVMLATNEIHRLDGAELAYKLKNKDLVEYLKRSNEGIKTLALITLGSGRPLPPATKKGEERDKKGQKGERKKLKPVLLVLILLAVITTATVAALKIKSTGAQNKAEAETLVQEISDFNAKIPTLVEVKNEEEALELVHSAQEKLKRLAELKYFKTTRATLEQELEKIIRDLKQVEEVASIRPVADLENNSAGFEPQGLNLGRNKILIYGGNSAYSFDLNRREGSFQSLGERDAIVSVIENPNDPHAILAATRDKIINLTPDSPTDIWARSENDPTLKQAAVYARAFYFLGEDGLIYKLPFEMASTTGQIQPGALAPWLNQDPYSAEASQGKQLLITNFEVEGSVYALAEGNVVAEFLNGELKNKKTLLEKTARIFTSPIHKNIYLLSPEEGLVTVLDKNLNLKTKYSHPELRGAVSIAVNSQERVIYFLKSKTVYSFEI